MEEYGMQHADSTGPLTSGIEPEELQTVWEWLEKLSIDDPVRSAVTAVTMGQSLSDDDFGCCVQALHPEERRPWQQKISAIWALGRAKLNEAQMPMAAAELAAVVRYNARVYSNNSPSRFLFGVNIRVLQVIVAIVVLAHLATAPPVLFGPIILLFVMFRMNRKGWRKRTQNAIRLEAIRAMGRVGSFHVLEELIEQACNSPSKRVRQVAQASLYRPLSSVNSNHFGLVTRTTMQNLTKLLRSGDRPLVLAVLGALGHIGDETCLGPINMLMAGWLSFGKSGGLEKAATEAYEAIASRGKRTKEPRQLLRAAQTPVDRDQSLLRPTAASTNNQDAETLMRSIEGNPQAGTKLTLNILEDLASKGTPEAIEYLERLSIMPEASVETRTAAQNLLAHARSTKELNEAVPTMQW